MSVTARRLTRPEVNLIVVAGRLTGEDLDAVARAAEASVITPDRHTLAYFRGDASVEGLPLSAMARLRHALRGPERMRDARPDRRIALVSPALASEPLMKLWTAFATAGEGRIAETRAFRTFAAAAGWLGLNGVDLDVLLQLAA
ncbi:hypothetical protein [Caulobacter sp. 17J65-9]|uniref:hypothetical protein n=1 Tax=Caulobacter sp. 17J65-9 TaxID=2709382 RepID=UPI0013CA1F30|nr:hypothetical protein [Caulobacter sp. 17J65-9]NEX95213.1 hypothetical protein [Caulobacter sp. 17J65-9]